MKNIAFYCVFLLFTTFPTYAEEDDIERACEQLTELEVYFLDKYTGTDEAIRKTYFMNMLILVMDLQNNLKCQSNLRKNDG